MDQELKACRNCGGKCDPTGWMRGDGRQGPECEGCGITTPDVESWNRLMGEQSASQGGEAVEAVGYLYKAHSGVYSQMPGDEWEPLMTVAQHQRILAAANHPADQVDDDLTMVKVSRELLERLQISSDCYDPVQSAAVEELRALLAKP